MSIEIRHELCTACGVCSRICPGTLIKRRDGKAVIPRPERCWGCAACVKECPSEAIALFLGDDIGGLGGRMTVRRDGTLLHWTVTMPDSSSQTITVNTKDSNKY
ncbi:MAG: ferredoxin family protein [Chitinispirillales bacterium]|jgi:adenylylsulfate reductase subunit B|nr:ferredoxin family protein [Chitinispirillales bacterium]